MGTSGKTGGTGGNKTDLQEVRVERRDTGKKGIPGEGCRVGRGPEVERTGHGWDSTLVWWESKVSPEG